MPCYQYRCLKCHSEHESFHSVQNRNREQCPKCGGSVEIVVGKVSVHSFTPHFSLGLGVWVKSRSEERQICRAKGLEPVGDMKIDDIDTVARRAKRQNDAIEDAKGPPEAFYKVYDETFRPMETAEVDDSNAA